MEQSVQVKVMEKIPIWIFRRKFASSSSGEKHQRFVIDRTPWGLEVGRRSRATNDVGWTKLSSRERVQIAARFFILRACMLNLADKRFA